jgi:hypothetical protein
MEVIAMHTMRRYAVTLIALTMLAHPFPLASAKPLSPQVQIRSACTKSTLITPECARAVDAYVGSILQPSQQKTAMASKAMPITKDAVVTTIVSAALLALLHCRVNQACQKKFVSGHMQQLVLPDFASNEYVRGQLTELTLSFLFWINKAVTDTQDFFSMMNSFRIGVQRAVRDTQIGKSVNNLSTTMANTRRMSQGNKPGGDENPKSPKNGAPFHGNSKNMSHGICTDLLTELNTLSVKMDFVINSLQDTKDLVEADANFMTNKKNETGLFYDNFYEQMRKFFDIIKNNDAFIKMLKASVAKRFSSTLRDPITLPQFFQSSFHKSNTPFSKLPFPDRFQHMNKIVSLFTQFDMTPHIPSDNKASYTKILDSLKTYADDANRYMKNFKDAAYIKNKNQALEKINKNITSLQQNLLSLKRLILEIQSGKCTSEEFKKASNIASSLLANLSSINTHFPNNKLPDILLNAVRKIQSLINALRTWISRLI